MEKFNASISVDKRMFSQDIEGSIAYSESLVQMKIISEEEKIKMQEGLKEVLKEWESGAFVITESVSNEPQQQDP